MVRLLSILIVFMFSSSVSDLFATVGQIEGERRSALVIGNKAYRHFSVLKNPINDARSIRDVLKSKGFDVIYRENATQEQMDEAIDLFDNRLSKGGVGLFYYAGHGLQQDGKNYLVPVDAYITKASKVKYRSIAADYIVDTMSHSPSRLNVVILDACRNDPFGRSVGGGLAPIDAAEGTYIAYATAPGKVAQDGSGKNGVFTKYLIEYMQRPLEIGMLFRNVRAEVLTETNSGQVPWSSSSITGTFYFTPPKSEDRVTGAVNAINTPSSNIIDSGPFESVAKDHGSHIEPAMIHIKAGGFIMGSKNGAQDEKPRHRVDIDKDFYIGKYEVTIKEYQRCVRAQACKAPQWLEKGSSYNINTGDDDFYKARCLQDDCPVIGISWDDAKAYTRWLSEKSGLSFRLPSESEWEYVARAGTDEVRSLRGSALEQYAWSSDDSGRTTHAIGTKKANLWGLHDIYGNVWEWCEDWYVGDYSDTPRDGTAHHSAIKKRKVLRGGSWDTAAKKLGPTYREWGFPHYRGHDIGFRLTGESP